MANNTYQYIKNRVYLTHSWLLRAGETVSQEQFSHAFSKDAPPLGWHLWHMARFVDRLQTKLIGVSSGELSMEVWYREGIASSWNLESNKLGVFETGMGQFPEDAHATIVKVGQSAIIDYAKVVFDRCNTTIGQLSDSDMDKMYFGMNDYSYDGHTGRVWASEPRESVIVEDLIFHLTHGGRHAGMMEALRGLLGTAGTLSV